MLSCCSTSSTSSTMVPWYCLCLVFETCSLFMGQWLQMTSWCGCACYNRHLLLDHILCQTMPWHVFVNRVVKQSLKIHCALRLLVLVDLSKCSHEIFCMYIYNFHETVQKYLFKFCLFPQKSGFALHQEQWHRNWMHWSLNLLRALGEAAPGGGEPVRPLTSH